MWRFIWGQAWLRALWRVHRTRCSGGPGGPGTHSPFSPSPASPVRLPVDIYLPCDQVLELLNLLVGLWVLLQVPLCKEGLVETGRATQNPTHQHAHLLCTMPWGRAVCKTDPHPCCRHGAHSPQLGAPNTQGSVHKGQRIHGVNRQPGRAFSGHPRPRSPAKPQRTWTAQAAGRQLPEAHMLITATWCPAHADPAPQGSCHRAASPCPGRSTPFVPILGQCPFCLCLLALDQGLANLFTKGLGS